MGGNTPGQKQQWGVHWGKHKGYKGFKHKRLGVKQNSNLKKYYLKNTLPLWWDGVSLACFWNPGSLCSHVTFRSYMKFCSQNSCYGKVLFYPISHIYNIHILKSSKSPNYLQKFSKELYQFFW